MDKPRFVNLEFRLKPELPSRAILRVLAQTIGWCKTPSLESIEFIFVWTLLRQRIRTELSIVQGCWADSRLPIGSIATSHLCCRFNRSRRFRTRTRLAFCPPQLPPLPIERSWSKLIISCPDHENQIKAKASRSLPERDGMSKRAVVTNLAFQVCAALCSLTLVNCENAMNMTGKSSDPIDFGDEIARTYSPEFVDSISRLEASDQTTVPAPGKLELTLSTWIDGKAVPFEVVLDTSQQVIALAVPEDIQMSDEEKRFSAPLAPSLAQASKSKGFVSASMLALKAKQFDDGLYAAVELGADRGLGECPSRRQFLSDLADELYGRLEQPGSRQALALLGAASQLGGQPIDLPDAAAERAADLKKEFLGEPVRSKPIGFYTWSRELSGIFQRDRLLQVPLDVDVSEVFTQILLENPRLTDVYRAELALPQRLTNPFAYPALLPASDVTNKPFAANQRPALFPPSRAYETDLIKKLYGDRPIPGDFSLADEMIRRIRTGDLDLKPGDDSGWYDYQTYALEPLVIPEQMPEAKHLEFAQTYKDELEKLFKGLLALTRETHIKQLEIPMAGAIGPPPGIVFHVDPQLSQEPLASFYLRRAQAYRFVRDVLTNAFGAQGLAQMQRLTPGNPINLSLDRELRVMESLFFGAYLNAIHELGLAPEVQQDLGLGDAQSLALFREWRGQDDPDLSQDVRMMVPVFYDVERKKTKVWAILGVTTRPLEVRYARPPTLESVRDEAGQAVDLTRVTMDYRSREFTVVYPVMAEVYVKRLLNRSEFRALCDKYQTQDAILNHLN